MRIALTIFTCWQLMAQPEIVWQQAHPSRGFLFLNGYNTQQAIFDSTGDIICNVPLANDQNGSTIGLLKYDLDGNLLWEYRYIDTTTVRTNLRYMTLDQEDNILIMGSSTTEEIIDYDLVFTKGEAVLAKISKDGEFLWDYKLEGFEQRIPEINHAIVDEDNSIYITGEGATMSGSQIFYEKLSAEGELQFSVINPGVERGMTLNKRNNQITVLGTNPGSSTLDMFVYEESLIIGQKTFDVEAGTGIKPLFDEEGNIFVRDQIGTYHLSKYDSFGNKIWTFEEPSNLPDNVFADRLNALAFDADKNIIVTGRHNGENYDDPDNYTNADILTIQLSPDGEELRRHRYIGIGDNNAEIGSDVMVYDDGSVYVAGTVFTGLGNPTDAFGMYLDENWEESWIVDYDLGDKDDRIIECFAVDNCIITKGYSNIDQAHHVLTKYDLTTSLHDLEATALDLKVFPNPFVHQLSFSEKYKLVNVYSELGLAVPFTVTDGMIEFNRDLPSGKYYLNFQDKKNEIRMQKVLKF